MESFPFSQSVKERSVIKLHLCFNVRATGGCDASRCTLFYLGVSPCLRCRTGWLFRAFVYLASISTVAPLPQSAISQLLTSNFVFFTVML